MVALVVVLGDRLPVGVDHVLVRSRRRTCARAPRRRPARRGCRRARRTPARCRRRSRRPTVPLLRPGRDQRVLGLVEARRGRRTAARASERPVEPVDPRVVRALDRAQVPRRRRARAARGRGGDRCCRSRAGRRPGRARRRMPSRPDAERLLVAGARESSARPRRPSPPRRSARTSQSKTAWDGVRLGRQRPRRAQRGRQHRTQQLGLDRARWTWAWTSVVAGECAAAISVVERLNGRSTDGTHASTAAPGPSERASTSGQRASDAQIATWQTDPLARASLGTGTRHRPAQVRGTRVAP